MLCFPLILLCIQPGINQHNLKKLQRPSIQQQQLQHIIQDSSLKEFHIALANNETIEFEKQPEIEAFKPISKEETREKMTRLMRVRTSCPMTPFLQQRFQPLVNNSNYYYIAILLYNSEAILPMMKRELDQLFSLIGADHFYISIYENGSTDLTQDLLQWVAQSWEIKGIRTHITIKTIYRTHWQQLHRIERLAKLRNFAMRDFYQDVQYVRQHPNSQPIFDRILFLNDIVFCASDLLEIMLQHERFDAHVTCPLDFMPHGPQDLFYDTWVSRTILDGQTLRTFNFTTLQVDPVADLFGSDVVAKQRASFGLPIQVYSCWNGAILLDAKPFYDYQLKFRSGKQDECSESECSLIIKDLGSFGFRKTIILSSVAVAYHLDVFQRVRTKWENLMDPYMYPMPHYRSFLSEIDSTLPFDAMHFNETRQMNTFLIHERIEWKPWPLHVLCIPIYDKEREARFHEAKWVPTIPIKSFQEMELEKNSMQDQYQDLFS